MVHVTKREVEKFFLSLEGLSSEEREKQIQAWHVDLALRVRKEAEAEPESATSRELRELRAKLDEIKREIEAREARKDDID